MVWKPLIFLTVLAVGVAAGPVLNESKEEKQEELEVPLYPKCNNYANASRPEQLMELAREIYYCMTINENITENIEEQDNYLEMMSQWCMTREPLLQCSQLALRNLMPCFSAPVKAEIAQLKAAASKLLGYLCDDGMANTRHFHGDGGVDCAEKKSDELHNCEPDLIVLRIFLERPEDLKSSEAISLCNEYVTAVSCVLDTLSECLKPSSKDFIETIGNIIRSGSFCGATEPI